MVPVMATGPMLHLRGQVDVRVLELFRTHRKPCRPPAGMAMFTFGLSDRSVKLMAVLVMTTTPMEICGNPKFAFVEAAGNAADFFATITVVSFVAGALVFVKCRTLSRLMVWLVSMTSRA